MFKIAQPCSEKNMPIAIRSRNSPVIEPQRKDAAIREMVMEEMERGHDGNFFPKVKTKAELFEERLQRTVMKRKAAQKKIAMIKKARREEMEEKERKKAESLSEKELEKAVKRNETLYKVAEIQTLPTAKVRKMVRKGKVATLKKRAVIGKAKKLRNDKTLKAAPKKRDEKRSLSVPKSSKSLVGLTLHQKIAMEKAKKLAILKKRNVKAVKKLLGKKQEKSTTKSAKLKTRQNEQTSKKEVIKSFIQINRENVPSAQKSSTFSFIRSVPKDISKKSIGSLSNLEKVVQIELPKCETKNEKKPNQVPQKSEIKIAKQINPPVLQLASQVKVKSLMVDKCLSPKESFREYPLKRTSQMISNLKSKKIKTLQKNVNSISNAKKSHFNKSLKPEVKKFDYEAQKLKDKLNYMKEMSKISQEENANLKREKNLKKQILSETSWRYKKTWKPKVEISVGKTEQEFSKRFEYPKSPKSNYFRDFEKKFELPKSVLRANLKKNLEKIVGLKNEKNLKVENEVLKMSSMRPGLDSEDQKRLSENVLNLASTIYHNTPCKYEKYMMDSIKKSGAPYLKAAKTVLSQREHSKESIISILINILHSGMDEMKQENRVKEKYENYPHNNPSPIEIWGQVGERPESHNMLEEMKDGVKLWKRNRLTSEDGFDFEEKSVEMDTSAHEGDKSAEGNEKEKIKKTEAEHLAEVAHKLAMKAENLAKSNKLYDSESIFAQLSSASLSPTTGRRSFFKKKTAPVDKKKTKKEKRSRREDDYSETESSSLESLNSQGYRESDLIQIKGVEHEPMILTNYKNTEYKVVTPLKDLLRERNKSRLPDDPTNERGFYGFSTELFWANQRNSSDSD